jgi:FAD/FMN-containing dehydrogenase
VRGLRLVTGDGSVLECSPDEEPEVFAAARVGVGAMGVVSTVTLQCQPAFRLHAVEEPRRLDEVLEQLDELVDDNDHYEFFYVPHTGWALTKANNRTEEELAPRRWAKSFKDDVLLANVAFGALCRLGRRRPSLVPRLARALPSSGRVEYVDHSFKVFASPRYVHFSEMEYAVPRAAANTSGSSSGEHSRTEPSPVTSRRPRTCVDSVPRWRPVPWVDVLMAPATDW